jgi:hypothetical protein
MAYSEWIRYLREFSPESAVAAPPPGLYCPAQTVAGVEGWTGVEDFQHIEFSRRGFLVVKDAFTPEEVAGAVEAIAALLAGAVTGYRPAPWGHKHGVLLKPGRSLDGLGGRDSLDALVLARELVNYEPRLLAIAGKRELACFLTQTMGDTPVLVHNMVRTKPPSPGDKPWHQDLTHFNIHPSFRVVTAWIALDDAPLDAGCLHFVPGSHLAGPARHVFARDYQIPDNDVSRVGQVAAPVSKGSCVLLSALVHHGSPPNRSAGRRLALQLTFKPAQARMITDEERILAFSGR